MVGRIWKWRRWACGGLLLAGLLGLATVHGCGPASHEAPAAGPPLPSWLGAPLSAPAPSGSALPVEPLSALLFDPSQPSFDPAAIQPLLSDPRLSKVAALAAREAYRGAADELAALLGSAPPSAEEEPSWRFQLGRLEVLAGNPVGAVAAFDRAAAVDWVLTDHARFAAADLLVELDQPGEALARLRQIVRGTALDDEVALATARAHAANRSVDEAAPIWRAHLARKPLPRDWQLVALRFAKALLNQPSVPHAEEAVTVARQVIHQSLGGRGVGEARELEQQALSTIPSTRRTRFVKPEIAELVARARDLSEARQAREALAASDTLLEVLTKEGTAVAKGEASCEAYLARGKGLELLKRYAEASDAYGLAIDRCDGNERQVAALFSGARAAWRGGKAAEARRRYAELEHAFPKHSYADDARLHGAETARELGDLKAFTSMLLDIADAYPDGDMVDEALFTLARGSIEEGDWGGAIAPLEKAVAKQQRGRPYWSEGRPQYFLARARLEMGSSEEGLAGLSAVIRDFPLSYYMVQAYAQLNARDPERARRAVHEAMAREPEGNFVIADHAELHRPAFLRAVALVRQGDGEAALRELESLGISEPDAHPSLVWASAFLLARIGSPAESHGVLRAAPAYWREHYPAGVWRPLWEVAYPRPFSDIVDAEVERAGIAPHLAYAIMREESAFKPRAVSHAGAVGLMQLILPTAQSMARALNLTATQSSLKRPEVNIPLGCRFLGVLKRKFPDNPVLCIPGYNAGPGAPLRWIDERPHDDFDIWVERIPYTETRRYTIRVIQSMAAYAMLYDKGMGGELMLLPLHVAPSSSSPARR